LGIHGAKNWQGKCQLTDLCAAMITRFLLRTLATVLLASRLPLCSRRRLLQRCVPIFVLEVVLLAIFNRIGANSQ